MIIKRFGESKENPPLVQWYESDTGEKVKCGEETIDKLWWEWVVSKNAKRVDTAEFTIFEYIHD